MAHCFSTPRIVVDHPATDRFGSAFLHPPRFPAKFSYSSSNFPGFRQKCVVQNGLPKIAESLYTGLGVDTQESMVKLHDVLLQGASQLGLPIPSQEATTWWWAIVAPTVLSYLFATPGTVAGLADFVYAPIHAHSFRSFSPDDVEIGRQLGEGSFGVVYEGFFGRGRKGAKSEQLHVVLKKAKTQVRGAREVHDSEIHMNYRLQRTASLACAEFLGTMQVKSSHARGKLSEGMWLVWNFQGDRSLDYYLKQRNFPENIAVMVLDKNMPASSKEEVFTRNAAVIQTVFKQILSNLQDLHRSGVVHRDVKPLNLILDQDSGKFKFIDFGACVDLRSGYNYVPNETMIDPTYAAPEHYVMPTSTPQLPPDPLCSLVSPLFWHLNTPDRFDLYSAGLILMQLSMKPLRHDTGLQTFNTELKRNGYNLNTWRANCRHSKEEFTFLDADDGAGWELATALLQPRHDRDHLVWPSLGNSRPSASAALQHRYLNGSFVMPKLFPEELPDPVLQVLPAFEGVAQKLSTAAQNVISTSHNMSGPSVQQLKDTKAKIVVLPSVSVPVSAMATLDKQSSVLRNVIRIGHEHLASDGGHPRVDPALPSSSHVLPSTSAVTKKLSHALHSVLNMRPDKVVEQEVDLATSYRPASKVEPSIGEHEKVQKPKSSKRTDAVLSSIGAVLPAAATSAFTLATGWLVLSGLNSSAQASYELGKLLMSSSGISGSAFLAFFLVIKPWLEEQGVSPGKIEASKDPVVNESQENMRLEKYKSMLSQQVKVQIVVEAVQELEMQMSSLEALVQQEQQVSRQQQDLVQKMESLLQQPSMVSGLSQEENINSLVQVEPSSASSS